MVSISDIKKLVQKAKGSVHFFRLSDFANRAESNDGTLPPELEDAFRQIEQALSDTGTSQPQRDAPVQTKPPKRAAVEGAARLRVALRIPAKSPGPAPQPVAQAKTPEPEPEVSAVKVPPVETTTPAPSQPGPSQPVTTDPAPSDTPAETPRYGKRTSKIVLTKSHPNSENIGKLDPKVFADARDQATEATLGADRVKGMSSLLALETPAPVREALNLDLESFGGRAESITSALSSLTPEQREAYDEGLKEATMESLFAMSDTCSGASKGGGRAAVARQYYTETFDKVCDPEFRASCMNTSRNGGNRHPLYGGPGTRFMEFNEMLNRGAEKDQRAYEPGIFGKPRGEGDEANVRHFVASSPEDVDGSISTVPGGKDTQKNVKNISLFVEGYIKSKPDDVNPIEILAKQYQAEVSNHACPNGNGRSALLNLMATAQDLGLPMPLMTKEGTKMIHAMGGQVDPEDNMSPIDAMAAVSQGIDRMLQAQETVLASITGTPVTPPQSAPPPSGEGAASASETETENPALAQARRDLGTAQGELARALDRLAGQLNGLKDDTAAEIANLATQVARKIEILPATKPEAEDLARFVQTDDSVKVLSADNQFGTKIDFDGALLTALRALIELL